MHDDFRAIVDDNVDACELLDHEQHISDNDAFVIVREEVLQLLEGRETSLFSKRSLYFFDLEIELLYRIVILEVVNFSETEHCFLLAVVLEKPAR